MHVLFTDETVFNNREDLNRTTIIGSQSTKAAERGILASMVN